MTAAVFRIVLDTNEIVAAGSRWLDTGAPSSGHNEHLRLLIIVATRHRGLYCDKILDEYARVLLERRHPPDRVRRLLTYTQGAFAPVEVTSTAAPIPPSDPDDEIFLLCAIDGNADYLVSEDDHLLALRHDYRQPLIVACSESLAFLGRVLTASNYLAGSPARTRSLLEYLDNSLSTLRPWLSTSV